MANTDFAQLQTDSLVTLYEIDLSTIAVDPKPTTILYLTNQLDTDRSELQYNGNTYTATPLDSEGYEMNSSGSMPRPTITVSNVNTAFNTLLAAFNSFIGATLTRYVVFYKYLDGKELGGQGLFKTKNAGWILNRKTNHNKNFIKWELKNPLDLENVLVPRGQFTTKCSHIYRRFNQATGTFIYGTCPYTNETFNFDEFGNPTSPNNDACGKRLSDCTKRFHAVDPTTDIPIQAFPLIPKY
jgi:lambda family phage minor tail protein L